MRTPPPSVWFRVVFRRRSKFDPADRIMLFVTASTFPKAVAKGRVELRTWMPERAGRWILATVERVPNEAVYPGGF